MAEADASDQGDERQTVGPHGGKAKAGSGHFHIDRFARLQRIGVVLKPEDALIVGGEQAAAAATADAAAALRFGPAQRQLPARGRDDDGATADGLPGVRERRRHCCRGAAAGTS